MRLQRPAFVRWIVLTWRLYNREPEGAGVIVDMFQMYRIGDR